MEEESLIVTCEGNLCTIVLNRPEKRNSLNPRMLEKLTGTFRKLSENGAIRTVIIRGAGEKAFCAGYDIGALPSGRTADIAQEDLVKTPLTDALQSIVDYPYPVIAMINGAAFGAGLELALCADLRIASDAIAVGMPPAKIGLVYSAEGLARFIRTIGLSAAKEMFFTGDTFTGERLLAMGLADHMVPSAELTAFTHRMAERIAANAPLSLKGIKRITNMLTRFEGLDHEKEKEVKEILGQAWRSEDFVEGRKAFLERRPPLFTGR